MRRGVNPGARPQPTNKMGADCLPQIAHIVILMMENHSYDNYFGMLTGRGDGLPIDERGAPSFGLARTFPLATRRKPTRFPSSVRNGPGQQDHAPLGRERSYAAGPPR